MADLPDSDPTRYPQLVATFRDVLNRDPTLRHHYVWGALCGVDLAAQLGHRACSLIEMGVAGGNGLLELEQIAALLAEAYSLDVAVYGFDTGRGLPPPRDHRDLPHLWSAGSFAMDEDVLRGRLTRAELVLGDVQETVTSHLAAAPPPVAFVVFDLDTYTSTRSALRLFAADHVHLLPRVQCYFDDIFGYSFCEYNGERLAIREFNEEHERRKIAKVHGTQYFIEAYGNLGKAPEDPPFRLAHPDVGSVIWPEMLYLLHDFDHPDYARHDGMIRTTELPLTR